MIQFEHQKLADNEPVSFALPWRAEDGSWKTLAEPLKIQFRRGNRFNSDVVADSDYIITDSAVFGTDRALVITLKDHDPLPESYLYYDILEDNGLRFGFGSIEIKRGVTE